MPFKRRLPLIFAFFACTIGGFGQIQVASPYSRFGLGDLSDNNNAWNMTMGQAGITMRSPYHVNVTNPASMTAFDSLSFIFEGGFNSEFVQLTSDVQSVNRNYATLGYVQFGFPVTKWWKTSLMLLPYSDVGYNVVVPEQKEGIGYVERVYAGYGGINRFVWGNGFRPFKFLSIGFNLSYYFGSMGRRSSIVFPDSLYYANVRLDNYITMNDVLLTWGAQYHHKVFKGYNLTVGAIFQAGSNMNATADYLAQTYFTSTSGIDYPEDTIAQGTNYEGTIRIPMLVGGGVGLEKPNKWMVGIDYKFQNWEKFNAFGLSDSLVNSHQVSAGGEIVPDWTSSKYFSRVRYRVGFMYQATYLELRGKQLNEFSVSLGLGLPLRGVKTGINLGMQVGLRGTTEQNLIRETYFKFVAGFSIYERWFVKKKYQ